jgi:uncharacterized protein YcbK (DUF882 family)
MHAILVSIVLLSTVHAPRMKRPTFPSVQLFGPNRNESLRLRPYVARGRPRPAAVGELTHFLRCNHTGKQRKVDPRLMRALYTVGRHFDGHRVEVYSGYRPRAWCTRPHSRHLTASAVDFHIDGVDNEELVRWLRSTFHPAGVGFYPNGVHVHLDLDRAHDTYWVEAGPVPAAEPAGTSEPTEPSEVADDTRDEAPLGVGAAASLDPPLDDPAFGE